MSRIQNEDFKTQAELEAQGLSASEAKEALLHDTKVYVTAEGLNKTLEEAITDGDIGGGGVGGVDIAFTQTFEGNVTVADFTQVGLSFETVSPLREERSAKLVHDGSVIQSFKQTIAVDPKFRNASLVFSLDVRSGADAGNVELVLTDETNTVELVNEAINFSANASGAKSRYLIYLPLNCVSFSYEVKALTQSGTPETVVDDIILEKFNSQIHDVITNENTVLFAEGNPLSSAFTAAVTNIPFSTTVTDTDNAFDGSVYTVQESGVYNLSASIVFSSNAPWRAELWKNGARLKAIGFIGGASSVVTCAYTGGFEVGDQLSIRMVQSGSLSGSASPQNHYLSIAKVGKSRNIITQMETFSSDTAPLTYAPSSSYTLATLEDAPVGTFITFTRPVNSNTKTQTTTAPTQSTEDMNQNGIRVFGSPWNVASTPAQPDCVSIQIGKHLKGVTLDAYGAVNKEVPLSLQRWGNLTTFQTGTDYAYNEVTGVLSIDCGFNISGTTGRNVGVSIDTSASQANGYFVINASKNPAVAGLTYPRTMYVKDVKAQSVEGGTATAGAFFTRELNTLQGDIFGTLSSNQLTLPAGKYLVSGESCAYLSGRFTAKIRNITDSVDAITGSSEYAGSASADRTSSRSTIQGEIEITSPKTFELQMRVSSTKATDGRGVASTFTAETYSTLTITKVE